MKVKIWKRPRNLRFGVGIRPCGRTFDFTIDRHIDSHFNVPVLWHNETAVMHFFGHSFDVERNPIATHLLNHQYLAIRGTAYIVTKIEERLKMRAWATNAQVQNAIAHLGLSTSPVIDNVGKDVPQQDIYAATPEDLFAIRMCL